MNTPGDDRWRAIVALLRDFAEGRIDADTFEQRFLDAYLAFDGRVSTEVFDVVDGVFWAVDAYVGDEALPDPGDPGDLDAEELRAEVTRALTALG